MVSRVKAVLSRCDVWHHYAVTSSHVCPMQALLQGLTALWRLRGPCVSPGAGFSCVYATDPTHEHRQIPLPYKDRRRKSRPRDAPEVDIHPHNIKMPSRKIIFLPHYWKAHYPHSCKKEKPNFLKAFFLFSDDSYFVWGKQQRVCMFQISCLHLIYVFLWLLCSIAAFSRPVFSDQRPSFLTQAVPSNECWSPWSKWKWPSSKMRCCLNTTLQL